MAGLLDRMIGMWDQASGYGANQRTADAWSQIMEQMKNEEALRAQSPEIVNSRLNALYELPLPATSSDKPIISQEVFDRESEMAKRIKDTSGEATPQQRWKSQVDYMMKSADPALQERGLQMLEKYYDSTSGGENTSGAWSTHGKAAVDAGFIPGTPAYQEYVKKLAARSGVTVNVGKQDEPITVADLKNLQMPDGSNVPYGTTPTQAKKMGVQSPEEAGKKAMLDTAVSQFENLDNLIFTPDGKVNRNIIQDAFFISIDPTPGKSVSKWILKNPAAAEVAQGLEYGMQAITRTETGAAMASEEISNTKARFMPGPTDSDAMVKMKWEAYKYFLTNASEMIDPKVRKGNDTKALSREVKKAADTALQKFVKPSVPAKGGVPALPPGFKME